MWSYLLKCNAMIAGYQTLINHTGNGDLKKLLEEAVENCKEEKQAVEEILKANGVGLPPAPPERPVAKLEDIPVGARFNDAEIAAMLAADVAAGLVACSTVMGQSIREDIGVLFGQFHVEKAAFGVKVLRLNKNKAWLIPPPLQMDKTEHKE